MAYTVGSAFYGLYFVVSFPVYLRLDEERASAEVAARPGVASPGGDHRPKAAVARAGAATPLLEAATSSLASGMAVLLLLDLTRLAVVGTPLTIGGKLFEVTGEVD